MEHAARDKRLDGLLMMPKLQSVEDLEAAVEAAATELAEIEREFGLAHDECKRLNILLMNRDVRNPDGSRMTPGYYWEWRSEQEARLLDFDTKRRGLKARRAAAELALFNAKRRLQRSEPQSDAALLLQCKNALKAVSTMWRDPGTADIQRVQQGVFVALENCSKAGLN